MDPARIEHTVLGPRTGWTDVASLLETARAEGMRACIPPCFVAEASEVAPTVPLTTVVGFPHGQAATETKAAAARQAAAEGAAEIDVVANLGRLADGDDAAVEADVEAVVTAVSLPVKVILEAPLLAEDELRRACAAAEAAGADYVKTATGFADGGATVADVEIMAEYLPVKASGGIGSWEEARAMFEAGAERIGASSGATILAEWRAATDDGG